MAKRALGDRSQNCLWVCRVILEDIKTQLQLGKLSRDGFQLLFEASLSLS